MRACMHKKNIYGLRAVFQTYTQLLAGKKNAYTVHGWQSFSLRAQCCKHRSIAIQFLQKQFASHKNNPWKSKPIWPFQTQSKTLHHMPSYNSDSSDRPQTLPTPGWAHDFPRVAWTSPAKSPSTIQTCCCSSRTPYGRFLANRFPQLSQIYTPSIDRCTRKIFMHARGFST